MSTRIPRQPPNRPGEPIKAVYILDEDPRASEALCDALTRHGYRARTLTDAAEALVTLRASDDPCALVFNVEAYGITLDGRGFTLLIGALLEDPALARSHIFAVISSTPEEVEWTLGRSLAHLGARVFEKPCDAATIETYLALASGRITQEPGPEVALIGHSLGGAQPRDSGER